MKISRVTTQCMCGIWRTYLRMTLASACSSSSLPTTGCSCGFCFAARLCFQKKTLPCSTPCSSFSRSNRVNCAHHESLNFFKDHCPRIATNLYSCKYIFSFNSSGICFQRIECLGAQSYVLHEGHRSEFWKFFFLVLSSFVPAVFQEACILASLNLKIKSTSILRCWFS